MSNILAEGRGRRAAAAAQHKYTYLDSGSLSDSDADNVCPSLNCFVPQQQEICARV